MASPRVVRVRPPRRIVAVLTSAALLLGVGAAFAATVTTPERSGESVAAPTPRAQEPRACIDCPLEGIERAMPDRTATATVTEDATPTLAAAATQQPPSSPPAQRTPTPTAPPKATASAAPAPTVAAAPTQPPPPAAEPPTGRTASLYVTGYGQPDNDPSGPAIAYPGPAPRHSRTGGAGSYADPVTVAVGSGRAGLNLVPGTRVYLPVFAKYGVIEDLCATCSGRWIDVFDGSSLRDDPRKVAACQDRHTGTFAVEINPPPGRPENVRPLFDRGVCTP